MRMSKLGSAGELERSRPEADVAMDCKEPRLCKNAFASLRAKKPFHIPTAPSARQSPKTPISVRLMDDFLGRNEFLHSLSP